MQSPSLNELALQCAEFGCGARTDVMGLNGYDHATRTRDALARAKSQLPRKVAHHCVLRTIRAGDTLGRSAACLDLGDQLRQRAEGDDAAARLCLLGRLFMPPPTIEGLGLETRWLVRAKVEVFCPAMLTDVDGLATTGPNGADDAGTIQRRDEGSTVKHSTGSDDTLTGNETIKQGAISTQIIAPRDFEVEPGPLRLGVQAGQFHRSLSPTSDYCWDWG